MTYRDLVGLAHYSQRLGQSPVLKNAGLVQWMPPAERKGTRWSPLLEFLGPFCSGVRIPLV